ncbi:hypothetical protein J7L48_05505 [bacterium]|nr:hypothetical protein [bacterium]
MENSKLGNLNYLKFIFIMLFITVATTIFACSPIVSLTWIYGIVNFITLILFIPVIIVKGLLYFALSRKLPFISTMINIFLANIFSSLMGIALAIAFIAPFNAIFSLVFIYISLIKIFKDFKNRRVTPFRKHQIYFIFLIILFWILSVVFYGYATYLLDKMNFFLYWIVKYAYVFFALFINFLLTVIWETYVFDLYSKKKCDYFKSNSSFNNMAIMNIIIFFLTYLIIALLVLPIRNNDALWLFSY